ncbi:hypothetical protein ACS0TY_025354 [Phlomoides rotata]
MSVDFLLLDEKIFLVGAIAKLGATVCTYPMLVIKVKSFTFPLILTETIFKIQVMGAITL